jgi:hypothetical protein
MPANEYQRNQGASDSCGAFSIFCNACAFCSTGITIRFIICKHIPGYLHGTNAIFFGIFLTSGFLAICPEAKEERYDEDGG